MSKQVLEQSFKEFFIFYLRNSLLLKFAEILYFYNMENVPLEIKNSGTVKNIQNKNLRLGAYRLLLLPI